MGAPIELAPDKKSATIRFSGSMDSHTVGSISDTFREVRDLPGRRSWVKPLAAWQTNPRTSTDG